MYNSMLRPKEQFDSEVIVLPPLVSVVMSSYNHKAFVAETIWSVLNQTFEDFEFIISDDHSEDGTDEVIRGFSDKRITALFQTENTFGLNSFLYEMSVGKYIAIIHSDDLWLPKKLEKQVAYLESHPDCAACFTHAALIDEHGNAICKSDMKENLFCQPNRTRAEWLRYFFTKGNCLCHPSILIRRDILIGLGRNRALRQLQDFSKWVLLLKHHPIHILLDELTLHRRHMVTHANTSATVPENSLRTLAEMYCISETFFDGLSDELFVEAFQSLFRNPNAKTPEELLCEKFFLLLDHWVFGGNQRKLSAAAFFYRNCGADKEVLATLREQYGYTLQDFYSLTGSIQLNWLSNVPPYTEARYLEAVSQVEKLQSKLAQAENAYEEISNSTSWKITKPFRMLMDCLRRHGGKSKR
jgi:glycosyltransferase involved in cell wall biosynthesis